MFRACFYFSIVLAVPGFANGCSSLPVDDQIPQGCSAPLQPHGDWSGKEWKARFDACNAVVSESTGQLLAEAQFYQGRLLYLAGEVERSIEKFEASYDGGETKSALALGFLAESEQYDADQEYRQFYQEAAEAHDPVGKVIYALELGAMTVDPTPTERQHAWKLLQEAAEDGFAPAYFYMGEFYNYTNPGEVRNKAKAIEHYKLAAKGGVREAVDILRILGIDVAPYIVDKYPYPEVGSYSLIFDRP